MIFENVLSEIGRYKREYCMSPLICGIAQFIETYREWRLPGTEGGGLWEFIA